MPDRSVVNLAAMKLLIVDDIPENIDSLVMILESEGYEIATAESGERALQIANDFFPDLVLLDINLGGIDGFETCRRLKHNNSTIDIPVIFITVSAETDDIDQGFLCGGVDYIIRPLREEEVRARVRTHLHLRALTKQKEEMILELENALAKLRTLTGLLPICAWCKKIRDDKGYWNQLETYIGNHSEANFTHCICPGCQSKFDPKS